MVLIKIWKYGSQFIRIYIKILKSEI
jgi:hypothetical protein